ncbi:MAG: ABC transporter ATP-binding protein [Candidatus Aminicenantia bacterium]
MIAIKAENLTKIYQKYSSRHRFQTFKSALVKGSLFKDLKPDEIIFALESVNLEVKNGTTFGVIGENGSGKSTLLKVVAGITKPTSGKIEVNGRVSALIELGAGFHPEITGRENVYINGIMLGLSKKEISEKFDEIVKFAELEDFIDAPVKTYSSGMYMRLGFAVAINVNPDILLVDEVLAVGDASFVPKCLDKISDFRRRKKTILFVSHDLPTVEQICDQVMWLKKGKVQMIGEPKRVVDAYLQDIAEKQEEALGIRHEELDLERKEWEEEKREKRWGKREIEIKSVKIRGLKGEEKFVFSPDEGMIIEMEVEAKRTMKDFVFGVGIFNSEGVCCFGTNTNLEDYKPIFFQGKGKVTFKINKLNFINGTYYLDVAAHKKDGYPYDYHKSLYSFAITSRNKSIGIYYPPHSWNFSQQIKIKKPNK